MQFLIQLIVAAVAASLSFLFIINTLRLCFGRRHRRSQKRREDRHYKARKRANGRREEHLYATGAPSLLVQLPKKLTQNTPKGVKGEVNGRPIHATLRENVIQICVSHIDDQNALFAAQELHKKYRQKNKQKGQPNPETPIFEIIVVPPRPRDPEVSEIPLPSLLPAAA